jgi:hypothetical protein
MVDDVDAAERIVAPADVVMHGRSRSGQGVCLEPSGSLNKPANNRAYPTSNPTDSWKAWTTLCKQLGLISVVMRELQRASDPVGVD